MRKALICVVPVAALVLFVVVGAAVSPQSASSSSPVSNKILAHKLAVELGREPARAKEMPVSSGVMYALLEGTGILDQRAAKWAQTAPGQAALSTSGVSSNKTEGCQNVFQSPAQTNTRVNQDCSFRRQAEEMIQLNPLDEKNIIAGQNDSRIGFNHCGYDWSFDGGKDWGDQLPPFWQFVLLDGHTADACSDPTGAWDSRANAYAGGILFDINSGANAVVVMKSNAGNGGAFYHTPAPLTEISGSNAAICTFPVVGPCNDNQGSDPVVGPDGTIYVAFANGNVPGAGIEQVLMVKCPVGLDCSNSANWTSPIKVGDMIATHPVGPPSQNGCPNRQCLPPNGYRVPDETSVTISVDRNSKLYVSWADHRNNTNPNCQLGAPAGGSGPCDHDIHYAYSTSGGTTWSATRTITPRSQFGETAQWQPWSEVTTDGSRLWVAYYDRSYGNCEATGCNDITAAEITNPATASPSIAYARVTTGSMPNLTPATNPVQAGFLGDYMWVDTDSHGDAHIVWADTRPHAGTAPEEDVYYAQVHHGLQ